MHVTASTVYDLTVSVEQFNDGTVKVYWSTGEPGHVDRHYDEGNEDALESLHAWVEAHSCAELARLVERVPYSAG